MLSRRERGPIRESDHADAGMTIAEVVIGSGLLLFATSVALSFFLGIGNNTARAIHESLNASDARTAIDQITTVLRLADTPLPTPGYPTARFTSLSATEVVFYSNIRPRSSTADRIPPSKVDLRLSNGVLTEYVYAPDSQTFGNNYDYTQHYPTLTTSLVLLRGISNTDVFGYCDAVTDPATWSPTPSATSTAPASPTTTTVPSYLCDGTTTPLNTAYVTVKVTVAALPGEKPQTVQAAVGITGALG